jgi:hypothetical protein
VDLQISKWPVAAEEDNDNGGEAVCGQVGLSLRREKEQLRCKEELLRKEKALCLELLRVQMDKAD